MPDLRIPARGEKKKRSSTAANPRLAPVLVTALLSGALAVGWYRSHQAGEAEESERLQALKRLSAAEQSLSEAKTDLENCKAWMDDRLRKAELQDPAPDAPAPVVPVAPVAPAIMSANAVDLTPNVSGERSKAGLLQRRRRMLELRGQTNNDLETMDQSEAGPTGLTP